MMQVIPTTGTIKEAWEAQNQGLVKSLTASGLLETRLTEAHGTAASVVGHAIERGLSPDQARELAMDAIALPPPMKKK